MSTNIYRFSKNQFKEDSQTTVGMEFSTKEIAFEKSLIKAQVNYDDYYYDDYYDDYYYYYIIIMMIIIIIINYDDYYY